MTKTMSAEQNNTLIGLMLKGEFISYHTESDSLDVCVFIFDAKIDQFRWLRVHFDGVYEFTE